MAKAVTIVDAGGIAVTNLESVAGYGTPMTPVTAGGVAVTLVESGGLPIVLIYEDGTSAAPFASAVIELTDDDNTIELMDDDGSTYLTDDVA